MCAAMSAPMTLWAQELNVSGRVIDTKGDPIAGASVVVSGTTNGTMTDLNGDYNIAAAADATLVFSFLGMGSMQQAVDGRARIDITMSESDQTIDAVVVTALGIKRSEKALSYNVQQMDAEEVSRVKGINFMSALAGKAAGVQIQSSAAGAGGAVKVVMRGQKSLSKNNNALYVIDGIPMYNSDHGNQVDVGTFSSQPGTESAADINPDDIESISLLTGPSAAALYGYEGANGVVLITTKKGRADRTSITLSSSTMFSNPMMMPEFQNQYGSASGSFMSWGDATQRRYEPSGFFNTGSNLQNSVAISTGNDRSQSYLSAAAANAAGILPNNKYERYNFAFRNTSSFLHNKLTMDISANLIVQHDKNMVSQGQYFNPLPALYLFPRGDDFRNVMLYERYDDLLGIMTQYWQYGDQALSMQNPYWIMNRMLRDNNKRRYKLSASLQYNITDYLNIMGRASADNSNYEITDKRYAGTISLFSGPKGHFKLENRDERQTYADLIANLNKSIGDFTLGINAGASIKDFRNTTSGIDGNLNKITNLFTTSNIDRTVGTTKITDTRMLVQQSQSVFANAEVGYKRMLYLTLTGRNDWDSALAFSESGERSFFYPSAGLSAILSEMLRMPAWLSYAKVRGSYTSVGSAYAPYITREKYEYDDQRDEYNTLTKYPNRYLKPEKTNSWEAGINLKFLSGMLSLDATFYKSNTLNQTFEASLPSSSGYSSVYVQAGDVQNTGVEAALGFNNTWNGFAWQSSITYGCNDNIVKTLANGIANPVTGEQISMPYLDKGTLGSTGSPLLRLTQGGSMGDIYANKAWKRDDNGYIYIDPRTNLPSLITTEWEKVGTLLSKHNASWRNSFSYKGITLNVLVSGRFGGNVVSNTQAYLDRYGVSQRSAELRAAGGITIGGRDIAAQDYFNIIAEGSGQGAYYVYSASNIRIAEVSVEYTIPRRWLGNITDITLGLIGNNLLMLYCKAPFDPELAASASNSYYYGVDNFMMPSLRSMGFSVKLQF
jgi:TonB-linked SusC/RagA family outer membrane protein